MPMPVLPQGHVPPAIAALRTYPWLQTAVKTSLKHLTIRVMTRAASYLERHNLDATLMKTLRAQSGGLVVLEGPPGSGITTLLAHLAATQPYAFWFRGDDDEPGAALLHAQLLALHSTTIPLVAPEANNNPIALERLLEDIATQHPVAPITLIIDDSDQPLQPRNPSLLPLPAQLPANVLIVYGCAPHTPPPFAPVARIVLAESDPSVANDHATLLRTWACPPDWIEPLTTAAQGNFLYLRLAHGLLQRSQIDLQTLPLGLDALYASWWQALDHSEQQLALLLAAAGEPLPAEVCSELLGLDARPLLANSDGWLVEKRPVADAHGYALHHWTTQAYLEQHHATALARTHVNAVARSELAIEHPAGQQSTTQGYLLRQAARHAALGTAQTRETLLPQVTQRGWVRGHERRTNTLVDAARDVAWELRCAAETGPLLRLVRSTILAGTLASLARTLAPEAAIAAFSLALEQGKREAGLKQVLALVEQLPDRLPKAQVLRQLGEACYEARLRTSAMRLLSQALDLEEQSFPRVWREQREQLLTSLTEAALALGDVGTALAIAERIQHPERRGMAETTVLRWLTAHGALDQARSIAWNIAHESLGAWALAEVAVALARDGDTETAETLLANVKIDTASAWAQIELACDDAVRDEEAAHARINRLASPHQRDRGLARLAHALAMADKDGDALHVAGQISDIAVRVAALLDLRLNLEGLVAMLAVEQATAVIDAVTGDDRVPLIASLAAAHASIGNQARALSIAKQLAAGEEQDRALSRVAAALAASNQYAEGQAIAQTLTDDDERDWTLEELTRVLAHAGRWQEAQELGQEIRAEELRARTLADLALARARTDDPLAALPLAQAIPHVAERTRALTRMVPALIAANHTDVALAVSGTWTEHAGGWQQRSRTDRFLPTVDAHSRYLGVVAVALVEYGQLDQARSIAAAIPRQMAQARVYLAMAQALASHDEAQSQTALGSALRTAMLGRTEAFRLLEQAVPILARHGGATTLHEVAAILDEIDSW